MASCQNQRLGFCFCIVKKLTVQITVNGINKAICVGKTFNSGPRRSAKAGSIAVMLNIAHTTTKQMLMAKLLPNIIKFITVIGRIVPLSAFGDKLVETSLASLNLMIS